MPVFLMSYTGGSKNYNITYFLTDCTHPSEAPTKIGKNKTVNIVITPDSGYSISNVNIVVSGATKSWNSSTNTLTISNPTDNVLITIKATSASTANYFYVEALQADTQFDLNYYGTVPTYDIKYKLSTGGDWTTYTIGTYITLSNIGDKIYFKGLNSTFCSENAGFYLTTMQFKPFKAGGDITTLLNEVGNVLDLTSYGTYTFCYFFGYNAVGRILDASELILPSLILTTGCYSYMFASCDNLTSMPKLPATTLAESCYFRMYAWCDAIETLPYLPATTLVSNCYQLMFMLASKIKISETQTGEYANKYTFGAIPSSDYASDMFDTTGGTFIGTPTKLTYYTSNAINIDYLCFTANTAGSTIKMNSSSSSAPEVTLYYSTDKIVWNTFYSGGGTLLTLENAGDKVYLKGTNTQFATNSYNNYNYFELTGSIAASGDITTLLNETGNVLDLSDYGTYTFCCLFISCSHLTTAPILPSIVLTLYCYLYMFSNCGITESPNLPATVLTKQCYNSMFYNCTSLTKASKLNATILASLCYYQMFSGCDLITAPSLPATKLKDFCYENMFGRCENLTVAPILPATDLAEGCYESMFYSCGLITAPVLPATTLTKYCYEYMFSNCTKLTTAPTLSATTLTYYCYGYMFLNCTSLTTAPTLPATTLAKYCYNEMFSGCTSINVQDTVNKLTAHIDFTSTTAPVGLQGIFAGLAITDSILGTILPNYSLPATTLSDYCYWLMFYNCANLTTAPALPATNLANYCYSGMFLGCTNLTTAPVLPATTLSLHCYRGMFLNCTNLTIAPELPATTLNYCCYENMFINCTSLTTPPILPATNLEGYCYESMFKGCTSLVKVPTLPVNTLIYGCYSSMFYNCTSLQVSDTQTSEASYAWTIPTTGTFTNETTYDQNSMFYKCLGTRSSNNMTGAQGESHTYYTQNQPIS